MIKESELKRAKRMALLLLGCATLVFIITLFLPPNFWISGLKAISEAAMVGALADWFAVVALFRRVPLPIIARHTAIIPSNKDKIADNLGLFVQEKFLDSQSVIELIRRHQPVLIMATWLSEPQNARRLGRYLVSVMGAFLDLADDKRVQKMLRQAVYKAIDKLDLNQTSALILESMTRNNRHQALLDALIGQLITLLGQSKSREFIAGQIVRWLKAEHPGKERFLPTEWLSEHSARLVSEAVNTLLDDISHDKTHQFRAAFDNAVQRFIETLRHSPDMVSRMEEIKRYLKNDDVFNRYLAELWSDLRNWLKQDKDSADSRVQQKIMQAGQWFGEELLKDEALQVSLNRHLELAVGRMAPDFALFITQHISDTVKSWDPRELSRQIELNIGKDLQFIRINGTLVGGAIGLILYLLSQLPILFR